MRRFIKHSPHPSPRRTWLLALGIAAFSLLPSTLRADAGLVIETPTGLLGFLSNVGHVSVWISHGCLNPSGHLVFCENSPGIVLTSTAYWPNPGAAAIPADLFFLGTQTGPAGRNRAAWDRTLAPMYPDVKSATGEKYLGRAWLRSLRVLKFATTPEQDRSVLAQIDAAQRTYRYSYSARNCAFYAQAILQLYFGPQFHGNRMLELGIDTPRAVERALQHELRTHAADYQVIRFKASLRHAWRQPARNICESAIFDPKYAIPLLLYEPYLYAGFASCYTAVRVSSWVRIGHITQPPLAPTSLTVPQRRAQPLQAFDQLTASVPARLTEPIVTAEAPIIAAEPMPEQPQPASAESLK